MNRKEESPDADFGGGPNKKENGQVKGQEKVVKGIRRASLMSVSTRERELVNRRPWRGSAVYMLVKSDPPSEKVRERNRVDVVERKGSYRR